MELCIDKLSNRIYLIEEFFGIFDIGTIQNAFGDAAEMFRREAVERGVPLDFSDAGVTTHVLRNFADANYRKSCTDTIWSFTVSLFSINCVLAEILAEEEEIIFSPQDISILKIKHNVNVMPKPFKANDFSFDCGMRFSVKGVLDVIISILEYYAFFGMKLKKCEHCGRWFATESLKTKYCSRKSPIEQYNHLSCYEASRDIMQQCNRKKREILDKSSKCLSGQLQGSWANEFNIWFLEQCELFAAAIKKRRSAESLSAFAAFLNDIEKSRAWLSSSFSSKG